MNDTTLQKIKAHLIESEEAVKHPYLDPKGLVTAGVGFNVDKKSDFTALDFWTRGHDGTERRATPSEKAVAYDKMIAARETNKGDHNRRVKSYEDKTNVFLPDDVMEKKLDEKAREHMTGAEKEVGEDAWNKLYDGQKAAVTDIRYANGSLDGFPNLKDAIKEGDAKKMADESPFYTDSKTGRRDEERLKRNYEALSGLNREQVDKRLQEVLDKNGAARKNNPSNTPAPQSGPDGKPITKELTPEQNMLLNDIGESDGPLDEILAKDSGDWTEGEFVEAKKEMINLPAGPEQERLDAMTTNFLEDKYGTGAAEYDAVGRMIDPKPIRPINQKPVPAKTPDGEPITGAVNKIGRMVAEAAGGEGSASAVQGLQSGLNLLKQVMLKHGGKSPAPDLKTDGVVGPMTRRALRVATSNFGRPKIEEGFALGRFGRFARDVQTGRDDTRNLSKTVDASFAPLFHPAGIALPKQSKPQNMAFQAMLNDLGPRVFEADAFQPIKEDGLIGPKTETAFKAILPAAGPDRFTSRLGHNMGFFDFDD